MGYSYQARHHGNVTPQKRRHSSSHSTPTHRAKIGSTQKLEASSGGHTTFSSKTRCDESGQTEDEHSTAIKKFSLTLGQFPKGVDLLNRCTYQQSFAGKKSSQAGQQSSEALVVALSKEQLLGPSVNNYNILQSPYVLMDLNINRANTGSAVFNAAKFPADDRLFLKSIVMDLEIQNCSTIAGYMSLYLVATKRSSGSSPQTHVSNGLALQNFTAGGPAIQTFPAAATTAAAGGVGALSFATMGVLPTQSRVFKEMCKILHTFKFILQGGQNRRIIYDLLTNKLLKQELLTTETGNAYIKGHTLSWLMVHHGAVEFDGTNACHTYGLCNYGWVSQTKYNFYSVAGKKGATLNTLGVTDIPSTNANVNSAAAGNTIDTVDNIATGKSLFN